MGKNQQYKAMQKARLGASSTGHEEIEDGMSGTLLVWPASTLLTQLLGKSIKRSKSHSFLLPVQDPIVELVTHWHRHSDKEDEMRKGELEADKDRMMREYRAQLDAERAIKLAKGRNHSSSKSNRKKDKDKDSKKRSSKKRKRSRRSSDSSSSSSSSESSSSDDEDRELRKSKSRSKKRKKEKKHRSRSKHSRSDDEEEIGGPLPLSRFFGNLKS